MADLNRMRLSRCCWSCCILYQQLPRRRYNCNVYACQCYISLKPTVVKWYSHRINCCTDLVRTSWAGILLYHHLTKYWKQNQDPTWKIVAAMLQDIITNREITRRWFKIMFLMHQLHMVYLDGTAEFDTQRRLRGDSRLCVGWLGVGLGFGEDAGTVLFEAQLWVCAGLSI